MKKRFFIVMMAAVLFSAMTYSRPAAIRVLVVTGGHDYNEATFNALFESMSGSVTFKIVSFPDAFSMFTAQKRNNFDVVVFYHMWQTVTEEQKSDMIDCFRQGKPLVVLHHSICAFDKWDEYMHLVGGRYFHDTTTVEGKIFPPSTYKHDVKVPVRVTGSNNPVTRGIDGFELFDEVYGGMYAEPGVTALLTTSHPESSPVIGWVHKYGNSRVVTIQSGHDTPTFENPIYRKLVFQAIEWVYSGE